MYDFYLLELEWDDRAVALNTPLLPACHSRTSFASVYARCDEPGGSRPGQAGVRSSPTPQDSSGDRGGQPGRPAGPRVTDRRARTTNVTPERAIWQLPNGMPK